MFEKKIKWNGLEKKIIKRIAAKKDRNENLNSHTKQYVDVFAFQHIPTAQF